jgi:uncharacterized protein
LAIVRLLVLTTVVLCLSTHGHAQAGLPRPDGRVSDFAGLLDDAAEAELEALSAAVDKETTVEIAVATVTSLDDLSVEEFARRLFNSWGIGKKDRNNGVLVLVAPNSRTMRIEVGDGLNAILPDDLAESVLQEDFLTRFRDGNYQLGIVSGVNRIAEIVRRNGRVTPDRRPGSADFWGYLALIVGLLVLGVLGGGGGYMLGSGAGARIVLPLASGTMFAALGIGIAWRLPLPVTYAEIALAGASAWIGFRRASRTDARRRLRGGARSADGWVLSGDHRSSGSNDNSSSSGDFGGGSSSGGGASGSW